MKISVIASLFPPDVSTPAAYAKELAKNLNHQDTTVIAYGKLPESVPGVEIKSVSKHGHKIFLIWNCLRQLSKEDEDLLLVNNGPSAEFPVLLYSLFAPKTKIVLLMSDLRLANDAKGLYRLVHKFLKKRAEATINLPTDATTFLPPEKLPFSEVDKTVLDKQAEWWSNHVEEILTYGK